MAVEPLPATLLEDRMADWLRPFTVDLGGERIARLRHSVEGLRDALSPSNAVDAVAYAYGDEAAGEGIIDYRAHFSELKRIGFNGPMTLEPHMDSSVEAARRCKEAVERIWESI